MKPIYFIQCNIIYAKDQPPYIPLPAHKTEDGQVTSCWGFSWKERLRILFGAKVYWRQLTFNNALQPVRPSLDFDY
ncbi:MAG: hypothetical protein WC979_06955 [Candidatus Pacearchaeota archaeon]|jgi:hypothetical protein